MPDTHSTTPHDASATIEVPVTPIAFGRAAPGIGVRDIRMAYDFYAGVLGFTKAFENGDPVRFMVLKKDAAEIHLFVSEDHVPPEANVAHIFVSDAAALHAMCEAKGIRIIKGLTDQDYGQRAFVLADPDGNCIDIGERIDLSPAHE
jgi:catechol 2,3-dioxygenase-like lactoylglutathione lyase family enzyme